MAAPKVCVDCGRETQLSNKAAKARGWVNILVDAWNDLWRCPDCCDNRFNR
jgi:hypothetical protein